jgi:hypothetical protein
MDGPKLSVGGTLKLVPGIVYVAAWSAVDLVNPRWVYLNSLQH